jgi:homogentisate 1,2-dioxygenase
LITTEFGKMHVPPNHIAVVQRNMKFTVTRVGEHAAGQPAEGYLVEVFKGHFELPELGPIGGNGLANIEDFQAPSASYLDTDEDWTVVAKYGGKLWQYSQDHSPYDVVAWMGNYVPYRYDLEKFNVMGSISYDHPDPSMSTVLTVPTDQPGTAVLDFCAFGPRWSAVHDTFRPQWFHRNIMAEFMATLGGLPSPRDGCNLHNMGSAHGPAKDVTDSGHSNAAPTGAFRVMEGCMIAMIETYLPLNTTKWAME